MPGAPVTGAIPPRLELGPGQTQAEGPLAPAPSSDGATVGFDVIRVEPSGESLIAGRAMPGSTVTVVANGRPLGGVQSDASGQFVLMPEALSPGSHEIVLQAESKDGTRLQSGQSVTVTVAEKRDAAALVTLTSPGRPVVVLSRPGEPAMLASVPPPAARTAGATPVAPGQVAPAQPAPRGHVPSAVSSLDRDAVTGPGASGPTSPNTAPDLPSPIVGQSAAQPPPSATRPDSSVLASAATSLRAGSAMAIGPPSTQARRGAVRVASIEALAAGRMYVSGRAPPDATVHLYLNETFVAPGMPAPDGRLAFSIERGISPGDYRVRLDEVDPKSGAVKSRAEVPFKVPATVEPPRASDRPDSAKRIEAALPSAAAAAAIPLVATQPPTAFGPTRAAPSDDGDADRPAPLAGLSPSTPAPPIAPAAPTGSASSGASEAAIGPQAVAGVSAPRTEAGRLAAPTVAPPREAAPKADAVVTSPASDAAPARPEVTLPTKAVELAPSPAGPQSVAPERPTSDRAAMVGPSSPPPRPGVVVIPQVNTHAVVRGDHLWRISRRVYGDGLRYSVIYDANTPQIRNPNLIYPGQVFVLPAKPPP